MEHHHEHMHMTQEAVATPDPFSDTSASTSSPPMMMHMHMTFYWGPQVTLLFSSWTSSTWGEYFIALLFCLSLTLAYEALSAYRAKVVARVRASPRSRVPRPTRSITPPTDAASVPMLDTSSIPSVLLADRVVVSLLFGASTALAYILMLLVMSFNIGVFIAVVAGHTVGLYLFGMNRVLGDDSQGGEDGHCMS